MSSSGSDSDSDSSSSSSSGSEDRIWVKVKDESSGNFYFFNNLTQESTWQQPSDYEESDGDTIAEEDMAANTSANGPSETKGKAETMYSSDNDDSDDSSDSDDSESGSGSSSGSGSGSSSESESESESESDISPDSSPEPKKEDKSKAKAKKRSSEVGISLTDSGKYSESETDSNRADKKIKKDKKDEVAALFEVPNLDMGLSKSLLTVGGMSPQRGLTGKLLLTKEAKQDLEASKQALREGTRVRGSKAKAPKMKEIKSDVQIREEMQEAETAKVLNAHAELDKERLKEKEKKERNGSISANSVASLPSQSHSQSTSTSTTPERRPSNGDSSTPLKGQGASGSMISSSSPMSKSDKSNMSKGLKGKLSGIFNTPTPRSSVGGGGSVGQSEQSGIDQFHENPSNKANIANTADSKSGSVAKLSEGMNIPMGLPGSRQSGTGGLDAGGGGYSLETNNLNTSSLKRRASIAPGSRTGMSSSVLKQNKKLLLQEAEVIGTIEHVAPPSPELLKKFQESDSGASIDGIIKGGGPGGVQARFSRSNPPPPAFTGNGSQQSGAALRNKSMLLFPPPGANTSHISEGDDMSEVSSLASVSYSVTEGNPKRPSMMGVGYRPPSSMPPPPSNGGIDYAASSAGEFVPPPAGSALAEGGEGLGLGEEEKALQRKRNMYVDESFPQPPPVEIEAIPAVTLRDSQLRNCPYVPAKVKFQGYCDDYESVMTCVYQGSLYFRIESGLKDIKDSKGDNKGTDHKLEKEVEGEGESDKKSAFVAKFPFLLPIKKGQKYISNVLIHEEKPDRVHEVDFTAKVDAHKYEPGAFTYFSPIHGTVQIRVSADSLWALFEAMPSTAFGEQGMHGALGLPEEDVNAVIDVPLDTVSQVSTLLQERQAQMASQEEGVNNKQLSSIRLNSGRKDALPHFNVKAVKHESAAEAAAKKRQITDYRRKSVEYLLQGIGSSDLDLAIKEAQKESMDRISKKQQQRGQSTSNNGKGRPETKMFAQNYREFLTNTTHHLAFKSGASAAEDLVASYASRGKDYRFARVGSRRKATLCRWLNSLCLQPGPYLTKNNLSEAMCSGLLLADLIRLIVPNSGNMLDPTYFHVPALSKAMSLSNLEQCLGVFKRSKCFVFSERVRDCLSCQRIDSLCSTLELWL